MKRSNGAGAESDPQAGQECYLCKGATPAGDVYDFYGGFCVDYQRKQAFLSNTVHIRAKYRDMGRYHVFVCDGCASRLRRRRHLPGVIGWGLVSVGCLIGLAVAWAKRGPTGLLWVLGLFGGLMGLIALMELLQLLERHSKSAILSGLIVERVKKDPHMLAKGDSFFTPLEYKILFKDAPEAPLTAEEILARDRATRGSDPERRPKPRQEKAEEMRKCPHCGGAIPTYAQACLHCKKILA
jgi:hypothetical protein